MNLRGRVALVTGAGSPEGIGFATALELAKQGAKLVITSTTERIQDRARELSERGGTVFASMADLRSLDQAQRLVQDALARFDRIDVLVNNAGMIQIGGSMPSLVLTELSEAQWDDAIAVNLKTVFNVTRTVLPSMLAAHYGRIINVASTTGAVVSYARETAYSAAKAAIVGFTRSLALEVAAQEITVNAIGPGWIRTASSTPEEISAGNATPVGRLGRPDEIAAAIAFLASEQSAYITGQLLVIDGGNSIQEYKTPR